MKVSVLIITYNHEQYIPRAIEGILIQEDCPEYEIIICDDHSTDSTVQIATDILREMNNVQIYSNPDNIGITKNYRQAFSRCMGVYVFIVEGDDYWIDPHKIKQQVDFMEKNPDVAMCAHTFYKQQDDLDFITAPDIPSSDQPLIFQSGDLVLNPGIISNFTTCCYRKSVLEKIPGSVYDVVSYDWMINLYSGQFGSLARINIPMSVYRISSTGAWSKKTHLEQQIGIYSIIPEYNRILDYRYDNYFQQKRSMIEEEIKPGIIQKKMPFAKRFLSKASQLIRKTYS